MNTRVLLFFFFKQKTAYEMRISDWSSDVCSSDLLLEHPHGLQAGKNLAVDDEGRRRSDLVRLLAVHRFFDDRLGHRLVLYASVHPRRVEPERCHRSGSTRRGWTDRTSTRLNSSH